MGVKGLWSVLSSAGENIGLEDLDGLVLALDLSTWLINSWLRTLFYRLISLIRAGVVPLVVLDGASPEWKMPLLSQRRWKKLLYHTRGVSLAKKKSKFREPTGKRNYHAVIEILQCLGVPYMYSNGEAEKLCVWLEREKLVDGIITEDSDVWLYGAHTVYRQLSTAPGSHGIRYRGENIREKFGLNQYSMIGLGVLIGCDMLPAGAVGIGLKKALKLVQGAGLSELKDLYILLLQYLGQRPRKLLKVLLAEFLSHPVVKDFVYTELRPPNVSKFLTVGKKYWGWTVKMCLSRLAPVLIRWHLDVVDVPNIDITYLSCYEPQDKVFGSRSSSGDQLPSYLKVTWSVHYQHVEVRVRTVETIRVFQQAYVVRFKH